MIVVAAAFSVLVAPRPVCLFFGTLPAANSRAWALSRFFLECHRFLMSLSVRCGRLSAILLHLYTRNE